MIKSVKHMKKKERKTSDEVITQMKSSAGKKTRNRYTVE